jgi:hypothetical protein
VLNEDERLAIAQHYGLPTALLDYTRSIGIAAFFATGSGDASAVKEGDVGVIYYVSPRDAVAATPNRTWASFDFAGAAGMRIGRLRTIQPQLPDAENRIARQLGLFIEGFDSRDLQRMRASVLYFRQRAGETFEDLRLGVSPSNRCDSHIASCCAPTRAVAAPGDGRAGAWHVPERDDRCRLRRRDDTA